MNGNQNFLVTKYSLKYLCSCSAKSPNLIYFFNLFNVSIVHHLAVFNARTPLDIFIHSVVPQSKGRKNTTSKWIQQCKNAPIQDIKDLKEAEGRSSKVKSTYGMSVMNGYVFFLAQCDVSSITVHYNMCIHQNLQLCTVSLITFNHRRLYSLNLTFGLSPWNFKFSNSSPIKFYSWGNQ